MNCPICGTKCYETTHGRIWCPNHGIVLDNKEEEKSDDNPQYIG